MSTYPLDPGEAQAATQAGYAASREHLAAAMEGGQQPAGSAQQPYVPEDPGEPPEPPGAPEPGGVT